MSPQGNWWRGRKEHCW